MKVDDSVYQTVEVAAEGLHKVMQEVLPPGCGFILFLTGTDGSVVYTATVTRASAVALMKDFLARVSASS